VSDTPNNSGGKSRSTKRSAQAPDSDEIRDTYGMSGSERSASTQERLGRALSDLLENPLVTGAIGRATGAREKAAQAQELWMGALNLPSASDIERLTRRLRSVSQRLEGVEDGMQRLGRSLVQGTGIEARLDAIERQLERISEQLGEVQKRLGDDKSSQPARGRARAASRPTSRRKS
jgi:tetrahydromethanopterin S-methyltransferase subunit G